MVAQQLSTQPAQPAPPRQGYSQRLKRLLPLLIARVRSPWVAAPLAVFLVAYAYLIYGVVQQAAQQDKLVTQAERLAQIAASGATVERLAEAEAKLKAIQDAIPPATLRETDVFRAMWDLTSSVGLDRRAVNIEQKGQASTQKIGNTQYRALAFTMHVVGDPDLIWDLVSRMDSGRTPYKTLVLDKTSLSLGGRASDASLEFTIYARASEG